MVLFNYIIEKYIVTEMYNIYKTMHMLKKTKLNIKKIYIKIEEYVYITLYFSLS